MGYCLVKYNRKILSWFSLLVAVVLAVCSAWWLLVYDNYHEVIPGRLYRSGQMTPSRLAVHAEKDLLCTVISLRPDMADAWHRDEVEVCRALGVEHLDFPMPGDVPPTAEEMDALLSAMRSAQAPVLVHCTHGADRTGLAVALYLKCIEGRGADESARALSLRFGHLPIMRDFDAAFLQYECGRCSQSFTVTRTLGAAGQTRGWSDEIE